ncbi:ferredoxin [candidate division WWE3 bacterium CG08_land_8_20_14_0_20_43_13]|uniref:Ferredoxin n=1 Tax=candidate division WWE3 bacterium CG08_land_8_20_14_0_20_43_13 TaxID=1975087 RepID=A0A2H0X7W8_UNCKA|nr:MAG: ferredoxin [candidate division WWE3 bacterium CG08_land_8_20_14_0_20_43_13]
MSKLKVNQDLCIGCGLCVSLAGKTFRFNSQNKAEVVSDNSQPADPAETIQQVISSCPVGAISQWENLL